jgi:hypothetical protein
MARTMKATPESDTAKVDGAPAQEGHNSGGMSADDKRHLLLAHVADIRRQVAELDRIKAESAEASKELGDRYRLAKIELGKTYSRKFIEREILEPLDRLREGGQRQYDEERAFARETFGFPSGPQGELFANVEEDTAAEQARWGEAGYQAGLQGLDRDAPDRCPPVCVATYEHRWIDGQKELAAAWETRNRLAAAGDIPNDEADEGVEDGADLDPATIDAEARKLRKAGFLDSTAEGDGDDTEHLAAAE